MSTPLIGMSFQSFLVVGILSAIAAAIVHWGLRYRLFDGWDGYVGQWMVAWVGAWLGPPVLGHWSVLVAGIHIIPAFLGGLAGAIAGTLNAKVIAGTAGRRASS